MTWLVSWMRAAISASVAAWLRLLFPQRAALTPWWSGRALVASVAHFCLALSGLVWMALILGPQAR